jgi:hypothetical protein
VGGRSRGECGGEDLGGTTPGLGQDRVRGGGHNFKFALDKQLVLWEGLSQAGAFAAERYSLTNAVFRAQLTSQVCLMRCVIHLPALSLLWPPLLTHVPFTLCCVC